MGTSKKEKKQDKPKKHKHKHEEKHAASAPAAAAAAAGGGAATNSKSAKKKHKKQQQEAAAAAARQPPAPAAAAAGGGSSDSDDIVITQQLTVVAAAQPKAPTVTVSSSSSDDDSDGSGSEDSDVQIQEQQQPSSAAPKQRNSKQQQQQKQSAAAASKGPSLSEILQSEGLVQCQVVGPGVQCELDLQGIENPEHKELWVIKLPDGVSVDSLHGRNIHIPTGSLPEARHLQPPPNPFTDPRADLLTYVQSAVPAQEVGHMRLGPEAAQRSHNHEHRELLQAHEFEAMTYSIVASVPPPSAAAAAAAAAGSKNNTQQQQQQQQQLRLLKVGRFIHLASDTPLVDKKRLRQVSNAGVDVWGSKDGWDGVLMPRHKPRRRLAGWKVEGGGSNGSSGVGDEEFEEVVFLQPGEEPDSPTAAGSSDSRLDSDDEAAGVGGGGKHSSSSAQGDLHPRFFSDDEGSDDDEGVGVQRRKLQGADEDRPLPGGAAAPFAADLQQWVLSLPVLGRVQAVQEATAQLYSTQQWAADRRVWWAQPPQNQYLAPSNAARQAQLLQQLSNIGRKSREQKQGGGGGSDSDSDSEDDVDMTAAAGAAGGDSGLSLNPQDILVLEELGGDEDGAAGGVGRVAAAAKPSSAALSAAAAAGYDVERAQQEYPCALPLSYLVTLPQEVEEALSAVRGVRLRQRLRNAAVLLFIDWREVWFQVDKDLLTDDECWQLVQALPTPLRQQIQVAADRERLRRVQARKQAAKTLGQQMVVAPPGPRPHFTATDQGYAPYQAAGEPLVSVGPPRAAHPDAAQDDDEEDAAMAEWLVQQGGGQRVKLLGASELRGRGLDWDTDAGPLRREGLHVLLPDGRDVHIPAGTDLDWQGELRSAWGFVGEED